MEINKEANTEVFEILSYMDKKSIMKIPYNTLTLKFIKDNRNLGYVTKIDKNDLFNPNNVMKDTRKILAWIDLNYLASEETKKAKIKVYQENEFNYEKFLKENNSFSNMFNSSANYNENINENVSFIQNNNNNLPSIKKENIFIKILNFIKNKLFK